MRDIEAKLGDSNPGRLLRWVRPFEYFINQSYLDDRNMAIFLVSVTSALLAITALGIFGLATFNVSTRIRQIGTRRAVGARRMDIVRHFLVENWMVTTAGVVAGCGAALGIGYWISVEYELPRLDLYYLVGGVLDDLADRPRCGAAAGAPGLDDLPGGREPHGLRPKA